MFANAGDVRRGHYIDGAWSAESGDDRFGVENPADTTVLTDVANATVSDARRAASAAAQALPGWRATPPRIRSELLREAFEAINARRDGIADLIVLENGKPRAEALAEVDYAAEFFRWFSEEAARIPGYLSVAPASGRRIMELSEPVGVALLLSPWNLPAAMITRKVAPALAAGCTVVLKPSWQTPLTALLITEILDDCGFPPGVVNVITTTRDAEIVADLLASGPVRALSFTGSTRVGKLLLEHAARRVVRCSMELGGNAPFIVLHDADVEAAVSDGLVAKMRHNAEACTAANRFLVHRSIHDSFVELMSDTMAGLTVGDGMDECTQVGPMVSGDARDGIADKVTRALEEGARATTGATAPARPGYFYSPTVLAGVAPDATILREEIFGPVAPIVPFDHESEAIALANSVDVGLGAYVHSSDVARAVHVAEQLEVGMIGVNTGVFSDPAAPFGGAKESGLGREGGRHGLGEFLEPKYINVAWDARS